MYRLKRHASGNGTHWEIVLGLGLALLMPGHAASAQSLDLQLSAHSLTFLDTDPQSPADTPALENPVSAFVRYSGPGILHVYMLANGNMTSGGSGPPVPASNVYWTASGQGYESGRMSAVEAVEASSGRLSHEPGAGWRFFLKHGRYNSGAYQLSITVMATVQ